MASHGAQEIQNDEKMTTRSQAVLKMAQNGRKIPQDGTEVPKWRSMVPRWPEDGCKWNFTFDCPNERRVVLSIWVVGR